MRALFLAFFVAVGGLGFTPDALAGCDKCGCPTCKCTECNEKCRCCSPTAGGAEQACPIKPLKAADDQTEFEQSAAPRFSPSKSPVTVDGVRVTADLPAPMHQRNTGGMGRGGPGTGAGLCVYTSAWHAAMWQNIPELFGFRDWMKNKPGGSWPEKFDATLKQYCQEKGIPVPGYIQHTGGDVDFLKTALKTGRMVCVTYAGRDDFYKDRWGRPASIAHMVNLVHLDDKLAVIVDNNRPGVFLRMSASDFTERWLAMSGGWAYVFTAPAPPPYAAKPVQEFLAGPDESFLVDEEAQAQAAALNPVGALDLAPYPLAYSDGVALAKDKGVPLVTYVGPNTPAYNVHGCVVAKTDTLEGFAPGEVVVSKWIAGQHVGIKTAVGTKADAANWVAEVDRAVAQLDPKNAETVRNFGVDFSKISREKRYSINGNEASKKAAFEKLTLADDSVKANVTFVGDTYTDPERWKRVPEAVRSKFNVQFYAADLWAVTQFGLKPGLNLREADAPTIDRIGREIKVLPRGDLTDELILAILNEFLNPKPAPPAPQPAPGPQPSPVDPSQPAPAPGPQPNPEPAVPLVSDRTVLYVVLGAVALYLIRKYL